MKLVTKLATLFIFAALSFGQQAPQVLTQTVGINAPNPGNCGDYPDLHTTHMQIGDPANAFAGQYICVQSGPRAFAWAAVVMLPPGTTGVSGSRLVYNSFCGSTAGNGTCANQTNGGQVRTIGGLATLSSGSAVISGISPAWTGTTTFACQTTDLTASNASKAVNTSTSSITITGTTSDVIAWSCSGY